jgi:hypothetical protein
MDHGDPEGVLGSMSGLLGSAETGPYVFRTLLDNVPLAADGNGDDIEINCVEFLGTRILHYVRLAARLLCRPFWYAQELTLRRTESLCWNICLRNPPLRSDPSRP